jgi:autotransporter-associated beta strand protein
MGSLLVAGPVFADIVGPYTIDGYTLHLYHLDEGAVPVKDPAGGTTLTNLMNGATLGNLSLSGYGNSLSTLEGGQDSVSSGNTSTNQAAVLEALAVGSPITFAYADPLSNTFTIEALVHIQFDPTVNLGSIAANGNGRNASCQIVNCDANGTGSRLFQFRIDPIGFGSFAGDPTSNMCRVEFIRGAGTQFLFAPIPTNGPDAIVSNNWYHVAVTYNGIPNTPSNLLCYWTLADPTRTSASLIFGTNMTGNFPTSPASTVFTIGNSGRNPGGNAGNTLQANFLGQIDEIRFSSVVRAADEMMFVGHTQLVIDQQPPSQTVVAGQPATFNVGVSGLPPLSYQWYTAGNTSTNPIANATNNTFTVPSPGTSDATNYFVVVSNSTSPVTVTSSWAALTVRTTVNNLAWRGTNNGTWDFSSLNWSNTVTQTAGVTYQTGDNVTFADDHTNNAYTVGIISILYPGSVTIKGNTNYTFNGPGFLQGPMALTNLGPETAIINSANTFDGPVVVAGGTLRCGNPTALGSTNGNTTVLPGATLDVNAQNIGFEQLLVSGNGLGGTNGAINNAGGQQQSAIRYITLTGDTLFNASGARWDVYNSSALGGHFQGNGFNLTKIGGNDIFIKDVGDTGLGNMLVLRNTLGFQGVIGLGDPTKTITCSNATLGFFATAPTNLFSKNVVLSNSSTISSGGAPNSFYGPVTLVGTNTILVNTNLTIYGPVSGATGGLTVTGNGVLDLEGTNSYTGSTVLNGNVTELIVGANSSVPVGPVVQLSPGTTLDISATPGLTFGSGRALLSLGNSATAANVNGNVTNASGSTLNPGVNGPGTIHISSSLALQGVTIPMFLGGDATQLGNGVNSYIQVGSALDLTGGGVNNIQITPAAPLAAATYTIMTYGGPLTGGAANLNITSSNPRFTITLVDPASTPGSIQVTVTGNPTPLIWRGGKLPNPNVWDHSNTNWFNTVSNVFDRFYDGDIVTFDNTGTTNIVNITQTNRPGSLTFNNNNTNYTLIGAGTLAGILDKEGTGTLTVALSNNLALTQITNNAGTIVMAPPTNVTLSAALVDTNGGPGTLVMGSTNTLTLTADNTGYSGVLAVTNGVLQYSSTASLGGTNILYATNNGTLNLGTVVAVTTGTKTIAIQGAGFNGQGAISGGAGGGPVPMMTSTLNLAGDATIGATVRWDFQNATINANGFTLTKIGPAETWILTSTANLANVVVASSTLGFQQGTSLGDNTKTITVLSNATLGFWVNSTVPGDKFIILTNGAAIFGGGASNVIVGAVTLQGPTLNTFNAATDLAFYGPISGSGGWNKLSGGTVWLYGTNTYSGSTICGQNSVVFLGPNASLTSSSTIEIDGGSTLNVTNPASFTLGVSQTMIGNGTVLGGNIIFGSGSTLQPGFSSGTSTLTMNGSLTFQAGSTDIVKYNKGTSLANDLVTGLGSVTYGGTLFVTNLGSGALAATDTLKIFNSASYGGYFANIVPATPAPGLGWNTNTLTTDGTLRFVITANLIPTNIVTHLNGNQLTLNWPPDHIGWRLLLQTNHLASGISGKTNDWDTVSGSTATNQVTITINPANPTEFYRLVYP